MIRMTMMDYTNMDKDGTELTMILIDKGLRWFIV